MFLYSGGLWYYNTCALKRKCHHYEHFFSLKVGLFTNFIVADDEDFIKKTLHFQCCIVIEYVFMLYILRYIVKKTLLSPGSMWRSCTVMTSCVRVDRIRSLLPVMHLICYWPPLVLEAVKCKERPCNQGDDEKRINIHSCLIIIHTYIHTYQRPLLLTWVNFNLGIDK